MSKITKILTVYHWTDTAVACYEIGCNCANCHIIDGLEALTKENCQMKSSVFQLVKKFGRPQKGINYYGKHMYKRKDIKEE